MATQSYLSGFLELPKAQTDEQRRSLWRQCMATLARAALEQQPVPLEGIDPQGLLEAVRTALRFNLVADLAWLSPPAAAAAVYELAAAIPIGNERRLLGREVLTRMIEGDAATFVALATSLAAESKKTLTGSPIRARIALALELPIGVGVASDALALKLVSRPDLRREWLTDPSTGSLPSRRLAARLLERAARESARRAAEGDAGSLRAFEEASVQAAWKLLLNDRESLVWRHVAVARGLLSRANRDLHDEIEQHLDPTLTPTEWRRAAASLAASIAIDPARALARCREALADDTLRGDPGFAGTMAFGLARAAEAEPEAAEDLLGQLARIGGLEVAEALVELRRERVGNDFGAAAARYLRGQLEGWIASQRLDDDGRVALCEALIDELSPTEGRVPTLRDQLDAALLAFADKNARIAFSQAQDVYRLAVRTVSQLEQARDSERAGRRLGFRAMRELDIALLETSALNDLLLIGTSARGGAQVAAIGDLFERFSAWLLAREGEPIVAQGGVEHLTMRLRRLRTLLHLVDADGSYGEEDAGPRRERRLRIARMLLARAHADAPSPLRRVVCAALARACDALVRDEICESSDVLVAAADHVPNIHDLTTLAEATMMADFQRSVSAYAELLRITQNAKPSGRHVRSSLDALGDLAQSLPWTSTLRVSALRQGLMQYARELEAIASARSLVEVTDGDLRRHLSELESTLYALAQLTVGARRRLLAHAEPPPAPKAGALDAFEAQIERAARGEAADLGGALATVEGTLRAELPEAIARAAGLVLGRVAQLSGYAVRGPVDSFVPPAPKEAPLPPWLPGRRIIGGFYVLRALGTGGVGSVFVVTRAEDRHREDAVRFALKVPDYSAEAARTLSEDEFLALFRDEAGALLSVPQHKNLAGFVTFDAGAKPKPILVMELVDGPTLERAIERGDMSLARAVHLLDGIASGLAGMHRVGIGHLDVKPSNVILRGTQGGATDEAPVLVDFGLAGRQIRPGCATGCYGAPEIWGLVPDRYTPKPAAADVYAFACVAYEALTGDTLFDGPGELAIINSHLTHDGYPEKLLALRQNPRLAAVCDLIANGLRQHPDERITIEEMREGFRELGTGLRQLQWPLRVEAAA